MRANRRVEKGAWQAATSSMREARARVGDQPCWLQPMAAVLSVVLLLIVQHSRPFLRATMRDCPLLVAASQSRGKLAS